MATITPKIPRHLMPQIPKDKIGEFVKFLQSNNINVSAKNAVVDTLRPVQKHVNKDKLKSFIKNPSSITESPLIITGEGFIIDGHHRWLAAKILHMPKIKSIVCNEELGQLLKICHDFDGSYVKSVHELTTYAIQSLLNEASTVDKISQSQSRRLFNLLKLNKTDVKFEQFHRGMNVELEHKDVTKGNLLLTAKIALAHLKEVPDYYTKLDKYVEKNSKIKERRDSDDLEYWDGRGYKLRNTTAGAFDIPPSV